MRLIYRLCHYNRFFDRSQHTSVRRRNCFWKPKFNSTRNYTANHITEFVNLTVNVESNGTIGVISHFLTLAVVTYLQRSMGSFFIFAEDGESSEFRTGGNYAVIKFSVGRISIGSALITSAVERRIGANCEKAWDSATFLSVDYKVNLFTELLQIGLKSMSDESSKDKINDIINIY